MHDNVLEENQKKLLREQLCYTEDIDYTESVKFLIQNPPTNEEIIENLKKISTTI